MGLIKIGKCKDEMGLIRFELRTVSLDHFSFCFYCELMNECTAFNFFCFVFIVVSLLLIKGTYDMDIRRTINPKTFGEILCCSNAVDILDNHCKNDKL